MKKKRIKLMKKRPTKAVIIMRIMIIIKIAIIIEITGKEEKNMVILLKESSIQIQKITKKIRKKKKNQKNQKNIKLKKIKKKKKKIILLYILGLILKQNYQKKLNMIKI